MQLLTLYHGQILYPPLRLNLLNRVFAGAFFMTIDKVAVPDSIGRRRKMVPVRYVPNSSRQLAKWSPDLDGLLIPQ